MPADETVLRIELQGSSGVGPPPTGAGAPGGGLGGWSASQFQQQPFFSHSFGGPPPATGGGNPHGVAQVGDASKGAFDPIAEAQRKLDREKRQAEVNAAYNQLNPQANPAFDAVAEAQKRLEREARKAQVDAEYNRLNPSKPEVFDPAAEAQKRVEKEARQEEINAEYKKLKPELDGFTRGLRGAVQVTSIFAGTLNALNSFINTRIQAQAAALAGEDPVAIRLRESEQNAQTRGGVYQTAGTAIGAAAGSPFGPPGIIAGSIIGNAIGSAAGGVDEAITGLLNKGDKEFLQKGGAIRGRARQLGQFGGPLAGALSRQETAQIRRDLGENQAIGGALASLTETETEYQRVQQQIQAVKRQQEAVQQQKKTVAEMEALRKELAGLLRKGNAETKRIADAVGKGGTSPLDQLLAGIRMPGDDHQVDLQQKINEANRNQVIAPPVFGGR